MESEPIRKSPIPPGRACATGLKYQEMPSGPNRLDIPASNLTLRDWFAGMALQGILANPSPYDVTQDRPYVEAAYILADSMQAEREK